MEYKIGISSFTYNFACGTFAVQRPDKPWTPMDLLKKAVELGADVVQFGDNMPLEIYSDEELEEIRKFSEKTGLILETGMRKGTPERIRRYLVISEKLHAKMLRVIIEGRDGYEPSPEVIVQQLKDLIPELERTGIALGIENYDRMHTVEYGNICAAVNHSLVGLTVDTTNSLSLEERVEQVLANMAPYCVCLHVKDYDIVRNTGGIGLKIIGACPGEGRQNIAECFRTCRDLSGRSFNLVLESWLEPQASLEESLAKEDLWAKEGIRNLRRILEENV